MAIANQAIPRAIQLIAMAMLLTGCAGAPLQYTDLPADTLTGPPAVELTDVPFHAQKAYQCGPAALATVMNHAGEDIHPDTLTPRVYLPERMGSLQAELLAATRRQGLVPYVHRPELTDLLEELRNGTPVLVMQNLGIDSIPIWHYAVVVGYDLQQQEVILRSGTVKRKVVSLRRFERTWQRGDYWALTVHRPGDLPASAEERRYLEAVAPLEKTASPDAAERGYLAALMRWPDSLEAMVGLGNTRYLAGDYENARIRYRDAVARHPGSAAAHHNLAWAMIRLGRLDDALPHAQLAAELAGEDRPHYHAALEELNQRSR
ncbi:MAG: PA2778 family cysteine peptidase [Aquisalimonadaceae bacterium]